MEPIVVTPAEAGQKLLQFLARRLGTDLPHGVLHRWIRTGQVRINGHRAKAFDHVQENDLIRVPPQAFGETGRTVPQNAARASTVPVPDNSGKRGKNASPDVTPGDANGPLPNKGDTESHADPCTGPRTAHRSAPPNVSLAPLPPIVAETPDMIVFCKPAGLPVHPGTGHDDSLATRIKTHFAGSDFMPTIVHRLDRDTSGLILAAKNYRTVRSLSASLALHDGTVVKEYLAWAKGLCPWKSPTLLTDILAKQADTAGREKMHVQGERPDRSGKNHEANRESGRQTRQQTNPPAGKPEKNASLTVLCLEQRAGNSLLLIRLHTGRTHQIRVQLATRGFPLLGDVKYGGPSLREGLLLHAARLTVDGTTFTALPHWVGAFAVGELPDIPL